MEWSWQLQTYSKQSAPTAPAEGVEWRLQWVGTPWPALEILPGRELEAALQLRTHQAPVQRGREEPAAGAQLLSSDEPCSSEEGKGKGIICAVLGAPSTPVHRGKPRIPLLPQGFLNWSILLGNQKWRCSKHH